MKKNTLGIIIFLAVVIIIILGFAIYKFNFTNNDIHFACTMEAKLCPDGSAVGRSGPNCEFSPCPGENQGQVITNFEECAAAGNPVMESYPRQCRANNQTFVEVLTDEEKEKLQPPVVGAGTVFGQILLGPTCPVMKNPPDPACADKPYQTSIQIIESYSPAGAPYKVITSDEQGNYMVTLPSGEYNFQPSGGNVLPRCTSQDVTVTAGVSQKVDFSCDSGIR